jgi:hypothetical protein
MSDLKRFIKRFTIDYVSVRPSDVNYQLCHQSVRSVPQISQLFINLITKNIPLFYTIFGYYTIDSKLYYFMSPVSSKFTTG